MRRKIRGGLLLSPPHSGQNPDLYTLDAPMEIGIPADAYEIRVSDGDSVGIGQILAIRDDLPVLSPISGVARIREGTLWVKNDREKRQIEEGIPENDKNLEELSPDELIRAVRDAGIPASSGDPLWQKLDRAKDRTYLVAIPAFDTEPYVHIGSTLARCCADSLINVLKLILAVFSVGQGRILLSMTDRAGRKAVQSAIGDFSRMIRIQKVIPVYPAQMDRPLFSLLTGRELSYAKTPEQAGVLILTPAEAIAVADLFLSGFRYTHTLISIDGEGVRQPQLVYVPVGSRIGDLPEISDRIRGTRIIENGLMNGHPISPDDFVLPTTRSLTLISPSSKANPDLCIGCDRCFRACPMYLSPRIILASAPDTQMEHLPDSPLSEPLRRLLTADFPGLDRGGSRAEAALGCIECGCCSYVCPARLDLAGEMASLKARFGDNPKNGLGRPETRR